MAAARPEERGLVSERSLVRRLRTPASVILSAVVIFLAGYGLHHALRHVHLQAVLAALLQLRAGQVALAVLFTCGSFAAIAGQEYFALRTAGHPLPFFRAAFGGFMAQSIGHSTGFSVAVGGGLRYRCYFASGVSWSEVAKVQASFSGTLALALIIQLAAAMLLHPDLFDHAISLSPLLIQGIGFVLALVAFGVLGLTLRRKPVELFGYHWELPSTGLVAAQVACSIMDLACLAGAAYALLPDALGADYPTVLGIAVASLALGIVSSVPGGLGIFESSVLLLLAPANHLTAATFGALLAFRALYYLAPLLLGSLALAALEIWRRRPIGR
jgi:uncharacterized membrane protein YbhN (UPF0104 family)